jgi:TRAP transporter TAXI family solute receptor
MRPASARAIWLVGLAGMACLVAACSRGPEEALLPEHLQRRLDAGFEEGLFAVRSFQRTGSAPFRDADREVSGVYVYYDAELEFLRDYDLTSWTGLNLGTLAFALGATEAGIGGFRGQESRAGDVLRVYGRFSYVLEEGRWQALDRVTGPAEAARVVTPTTLEGSGPAAVLRSVRSLVGRADPGARAPRDAVIVDELRRAAGQIDLRFAKLEGKLTLGTGRRPGTYQDFGAAFAAFATAEALPMHDHRSDGSVRNGFDVHSLLLDFALMQSDVAEILFTGWVEEEQIARPNLRSLASLWPEAVHLVTLEGSGIERLADLRGKRIASGLPGSGSRFNATRLSTAVGLRRRDFAEIRQVGLAQSITELENGEIDALFTTEAVPSPALQALLQRRSDVRLVPLDADVVARLSKRYFSYYPFEIPARTYPGQQEPVRSLAMTAVLVTNRLAPDEQVERVLELIVDSADGLSRDFFRAGFISRETMRLGIAVPLHPAATRFYERLDEASPPPESPGP